MPNKITYADRDELCFTIKSSLQHPLFIPPQFCNELVFISLSALPCQSFGNTTGRNSCSYVDSEGMHWSENPAVLVKVETRSDVLSHFLLPRVLS